MQTIFTKKYITITDNIDLSIDGIEPAYEDLISTLSTKNSIRT